VICDLDPSRLHPHPHIRKARECMGHPAPSARRFSLRLSTSLETRFLSVLGLTKIRLLGQTIFEPGQPPVG